MFQHIVCSSANRQGLFAYVRTCKTRLDTTTKFMVVVTSRSILLFHHSLTTCAVDLSWWFQQRCSNLFIHQVMNSLFQHIWTNLSTTMFKLASSTMFKPVNRQKQAVRFYVCTTTTTLLTRVPGLIWKSTQGYTQVVIHPTITPSDRAQRWKATP